ncbi:MAG: S8 family peptidase [Desulfatibacillaceae bacterium]
MSGKLPAVIALLITLAVGPGPASARDAPVVRLEGGRLTVQAESTPLVDVLTRLAAQGVKVRMDPRVNPEVTAWFISRKVQDGLDALLRDQNYALTWKTVRGPDGPVSRLAEIEVFVPGGRDRLVSLVKRPTLDVRAGPNGSLYVDRELIVYVARGATPEHVADLLRKTGAEIIAVDTRRGAYRLRLPGDAEPADVAASISGHPAVAGASPNSAYPLPQRRNARPPEQERIPAPGVMASGAPTGVPVAILDSGLAPKAGLDGFLLASLDAMEPEAPMDDIVGHGTQMALVASGQVAPHSALERETGKNPVIAVRAFDDNGYTSDCHIATSVDFAIENGARVISLSWGGGTPSPYLEKVLRDARDRGAVVVAAAGNAPTGEPVYPAAYDSTVGVGALRPDGSRWDKSNYGDFVSLYAPGFATMPVGYNGDPGEYAGTSISTAYLSNVIATHMAKNPGLTAEEVYRALERNGAEDN